MIGENFISNWYELQKNLFKEVIRKYILENRAWSPRPTTHDYLPVNA
jgi:hypothetical protein